VRAVTEAPALSIVIPAYNEDQRLPTTLAEIRRHLIEDSVSFEIIVVDDGSTDGTIKVVEDAIRCDPRVRLLVNPHRGKGYSVRSGVLAAHGARIVFCDADLSMSVEDITRLSGDLAHHPVVLASREGHGARRVGEPYYRHVLGRAFNTLVRLLVVPGIEDTQCGFKCFTADAARAIFSRVTIDGFGFDVEVLFLARRLGCTPHVVPITWTHQPDSRVSPLLDSIRMLGDVLRVRWNDWRGHYRCSPTHASGLARC
jgi:glycosyltransferase involved in cell wall biosynthesis